MLILFVLALLLFGSVCVMAAAVSYARSPEGKRDTEVRRKGREKFWEAVDAATKRQAERKARKTPADIAAEKAREAKSRHHAWVATKIALTPVAGIIWLPSIFRWGARKTGKYLAEGAAQVRPPDRDAG